MALRIINLDRKLWECLISVPQFLDPHLGNTWQLAVIEWGGPGIIWSHFHGYIRWLMWLTAKTSAGTSAESIWTTSGLSMWFGLPHRTEVTWYWDFLWSGSSQPVWVLQHAVQKMHHLLQHSLGRSHSIISNPSIGYKQVTKSSPDSTRGNRDPTSLLDVSKICR